MQRLATGLQNGVARFTLVWSIASALSSITTAGWSQTLTWLGTLGGYRSWAKGVSADGSVVVGWARNAAGWDRAFRWTAAGGMQDIGTLGGNRSEAFGVSADGSVVIGEAQSAEKSNRLGSFLAFPRICAFRWTVASGVQDLGRLPGGSDSWARGVSSDGSVVVGGAEIASRDVRTFRWTASSGMVDIGSLGGDYSVANAVSADGSVVVGGAKNAAKRYHAFRWTATGGIQDLGTLGGTESEALGVSADGSVVVGRAKNAAGKNRAFRWTAAGGMQDLGTLGGTESWAYGVSADGSVVVGESKNVARKSRAFRWTAAGGMEDLNTTYASLLTNGSVLEVASAISPDGRYIVGKGWNAATKRPEAFLLDTGPRSVQGASGLADRK